MTSSASIAQWLADLGLSPVGTAEREGVRSWDLILDGRRRRTIPMTLILDERIGLVFWVQYAPPLADSLRKVYRQLLRWNDELPFVKFALGADEQPVLIDELPSVVLSRDNVGLTIARLIAVCDLLYPESAAWVDRVRQPDRDVDPAGGILVDRFADQLAELLDRPDKE